jgi:hypothetical protein
MPDDLDALFGGIEREITRRVARGRALADRFPDLGAYTRYDQFLLACLDAGLDLDFVTSSAMFEELERRREEQR